VITPFTPITICSNDVVQAVAVSVPPAGSWSTNGTGSFSNTQTPQSTYTPGAGEVGNIELVWTTIDPDGANGTCAAINETLELDILQTAIADISNLYSVCANEEVSVSAIQNGAGTWTVNPSSAGNFANASSSTTNFIPDVDFFTAQTFQISWTTFDPDGIGPCLSAADFTTVSILPLPQITMAPSFSIPCGDDISATVATYQNVSYTFSWTPEEGLIQPNQLTTPAVGDDEYVLTVTDANLCTNSDTTVVDAIALANMASAPDASTCLYVPIQLSGVAADGQGPFTYSWVATEEVTPSALDNTLADFVFDDYILQDSILNIEFEVSDLFGCTDDTIISVTVFALPAINPGPYYTLCADTQSFVLNGYTPIPASGIVGSWSPSDEIVPSTLNIGDNGFTYTYTDLNNCTNDSSIVVTIKEVPTLQFSLPPTACVQVTVPIENQSSCGTCTGINYHWDTEVAGLFSDLETPDLIYPQADTGLQEIFLVATSEFGCEDTISQEVYLVLPPVAQFEATFDPSGCAPLAVSFENQSQGLFLNYLWTIDSLGTTVITDSSLEPLPLFL
ncbi:MAG: hypothetical protein ACKOW8_02075, partial [Flavobacteriales bacterium]